MLAGAGPGRQFLHVYLPLLAPEAAASVPPPLVLSAESARVAAMRERLRALGPPPYIGIAWRSGEPRTGIFETLFKEVPLDGLGAALRDVPATLVSVQRNPAPGETQSVAAHGLGWRPREQRARSLAWAAWSRSANAWSN